MATSEIKPQLYLESLTLVGQWDFADIETDTCDLCKKHLMELPPTKDKVYNIYNVDKMPSISTGECKCSFHTYCIDNYIKTNVSCPIDNTPWRLKCTSISKRNEVSSLNVNKINNTLAIKGTNDTQLEIKKNKPENKISSILSKFAVLGKSEMPVPIAYASGIGGGMGMTSYNNYGGGGGGAYMVGPTGNADYYGTIQNGIVATTNSSVAGLTDSTTTTSFQVISTKTPTIDDLPFVM